MLNKKFRGLSGDQVSEFFTANCQQLSNRFFQIRWAPTDLGRSQFVSVIPQKIVRSVPKRQGLKRKVADVVRLHYSRWTVSVRIAILVRSPALLLSSQDFKAALLELMTRFQSRL